MIMQVLFSAAVIVLVPVQLFLEHKTMFYLHSSTIDIFLFTFFLFLFSLHHVDPTLTPHQPYIDLPPSTFPPPHFYFFPSFSFFSSSSSFLLFSLLFLHLFLFLLSVLGFTSLLGARFLSSIHSNDPRRHLQCHRLRRGL